MWTFIIGPGPKCDGQHCEAYNNKMSKLCQQLPHSSFSRPTLITHRPIEVQPLPPVSGVMTFAIYIACQPQGAAWRSPANSYYMLINYHEIAYFQVAASITLCPPFLQDFVKFMRNYNIIVQQNVFAVPWDTEHGQTDTCVQQKYISSVRSVTSTLSLISINVKIILKMYLIIQFSPFTFLEM